LKRMPCGESKVASLRQKREKALTVCKGKVEGKVTQSNSPEPWVTGQKRETNHPAKSRENYRRGVFAEQSLQHLGDNEGAGKM